ncbi:hypothetical protein HED60_01130 [Planctomycetales bacterium ZRK34]|nr:hypothetical protein HED60_01130 [Planctomycetales bacterium ZRK34]
MKFTKTLKSMAFAAVLSMGLGGVASANTVIFDDAIAPALPSTITLKFRNYDMGTVYNYSGGATLEDTGNAANANDINNPLNITQQAIGAQVGSGGLEDTWGIADVRELFMPSNADDPVWSSGDLDRELTIMFYNAVDFITSTDGTSQYTSSKGMIIDIYESDSVVGAYDSSGGSANRTGLDSYNTVTDGTLVLRLMSEAGHLGASTVNPGGLDSEVITAFNPTASGEAGEGQGFFSVVGGAWANAFDSDIFAPAAQGYNAADIKIQFTTFSTTTADWLVSSEDPATGYVVPLPGAASMGFGLMGLVGLARKRRSA